MIVVSNIYKRDVLDAPSPCLIRFAPRYKSKRNQDVTPIIAIEISSDKSGKPKSHDHMLVSCASKNWGMRGNFKR